MATLKLVPGQRVNLTVHSIEEVQGNFGPQYAFKGETPDDANATLYLNIEPADRQLSRIGFNTRSVIGQTVEIARTEKDGRKYTDINRAGSNEPPVKPVATSGKAPYSSGPPLPYETETGAPPADALPKPTPRLDALFTLYDVCFDHALLVAKKLDAADIGSDAETVHSIASTLFIGATK